MNTTTAIEAMRRVNPRSLRRWAELGLVRAGLLETPHQRGQREMLNEAFTLTGSSKVEGDYLEFGVYRGDSFVNAWHAARGTGQSGIRFYAFDSFRGLPDPSSSEVDKDGEFVEGQFSAARGQFERNLRSAGVDMGRVTVVEGFYESTLADTKPREMGLEAASIVWIDCDLYSSAIAVLDFVTDLLQDGSVLVFDDWYCFRARPDRGEQQACSEWLSRNPGITLVPYRDFHWAGQSFVVNLSSAI